MGIRREVRTLEDFQATGRSIRAFCSHYYVCSHDAHLRLELLARLQEQRADAIASEMPGVGVRKGGRKFGR